MPKSKREYKTFEFNLTETKEVEDESGQKFGIIMGYASTFDNVDRGDDRILRGAFGESLALYKVKNRLIKMHFQHSRDDVIGGFNPEKMFEDAKGLFVEGKINLAVQRGREVYALAKQGVLTDFSIGFSVDDFSIEDGIRELKKLTLWEISVVGEPMNPEAEITDIKKDKSLQLEIDDIESISTKKEFEKILRDSGVFSRKAATYLASIVTLTEKQSDSDKSVEEKDDHNDQLVVLLKEALNISKTI